MTTKANRTREAAKRIERAKREYGLDDGQPRNVGLRLLYAFAESPWALLAALAAMVACIVVLVL